MIINYFKVPFGFTDIKSGLGPISLSTDDIVMRLRDLGIRVSPQVAQEWFRIGSSIMSGQYLSGIGTTVQNMTALQQNVINWGWDSLTNALETYKEDTEGWRDFIQRSGVIEFRDFFNKTLTADYIHDTIELDVHRKILGEILRYYNMKRLLKDGKSLRGAYSKVKGAKDLEVVLEEEISKVNLLII